MSAQAARFDARNHGARKGLGADGGLVLPKCRRCGSTAPLFRRPLPGRETTWPLFDSQLEPALCGLCFDNIRPTAAAARND